jgi:hypothetical protein
MRYTAHELPHTCNITPALENVKGIYKNIEKIKKNRSVDYRESE